MQNNLKKQSVKSVGWNLIENFASYILKFAIGIILARLLTPKDYGLIGISLIFFSIAEVLITNGLGQAFIQKKDASEKDANTIFLTNFVLSVSIYIILWFAAPAIAKYFNQVELTKIIRVLSVVVILNAINIIQIAIIRKNLEFKKKTIITLISTFLSGIIGIFLAYSGFGVWSLVAQQIINKLIFCFYLYFSSSWKIKFEFSKSSFKSLFSYGVWLLLNGVFTRTFENIYRLAIGKFYNASQLGFFDKGQQFPSMIYQQISWSVGSVAFPVYSKLLDNKSELEKTLTNFVKYSTLITVPFLAILYIVSEPFVMLILTEKWAGSIVFIKLFCIIGVLIPLYDFLTQFIEAIGRTKHVFVFTIILNSLRLINVLIFLKSGIDKILIGEIAIIFCSIIWTSFYSKSLIGFNFLRVLMRLKGIYFSVISIVIIGLILTTALKTSMTLQLVIPPIVMGLVYLILIKFVEKNIFNSFLSYIKK